MYHRLFHIIVTLLWIMLVSLGMSIFLPKEWKKVARRAIFISLGLAGGLMLLSEYLNNP